MIIVVCAWPIADKKKMKNSYRRGARQKAERIKRQSFYAHQRTIVEFFEPEDEEKCLD